MADLLDELVVPRDELVPLPLSQRVLQRQQATRTHMCVHVHSLLYAQNRLLNLVHAKCNNYDKYCDSEFSNEIYKTHVAIERR